MISRKRAKIKTIKNLLMRIKLLLGEKRIEKVLNLRNFFRLWSKKNSQTEKNKELDQRPIKKRAKVNHTR